MNVFFYACQKLMHQIHVFFFFTADSFGLGEENGDEGEDVINECPCSTGIQNFF